MKESWEKDKDYIELKKKGIERVNKEAKQEESVSFEWKYSKYQRGQTIIDR